MNKYIVGFLGAIVLVVLIAATQPKVGNQQVVQATNGWARGITVTNMTNYGHLLFADDVQFLSTVTFSADPAMTLNGQLNAQGAVFGGDVTIDTELLSPLGVLTRLDTPLVNSITISNAANLFSTAATITSALTNLGFSILNGPITNISSVKMPTNNAAHNTLSSSGLNTISIGKGWTNNLGARADILILVQYIHSTTGNAAFSHTNFVTGEVWTNSCGSASLASTNVLLTTIPDISPSDNGIFVDRSGSGGSVTFLNAWWKLK